MDSDFRIGKGKFITLYGVNNIGKSTNARKLIEYLKAKGYDAVYIKYPIYDLEPTGPEINRIVRNSAQTVSEEDLQKLFHKNRKDFEPTLKKILAEGKIVIAEDYTGTGIAWGVAKGLSLESMKNLNQNLLREDLAILLIGKRHVQAKESQHIHEQNEELLYKVEKVLEMLANKYGWRKYKIEYEIEETAQILGKMVEEFLQR